MTGRESWAQYLKEIAELLTEIKAEDNPEALQRLMLKMLAHRATLVTMLAQAESELDEAQARNIPAKMSGKTEIDRKVELDNAVKEYRYRRDIIDGYVQTIDKQVSACQTILSYEKQHMAFLPEGEHHG